MSGPAAQPQTSSILPSLPTTKFNVNQHDSRFCPKSRKCHPKRVSGMGAPKFHQTFFAVELEPFRPEIEQTVDPHRRGNDFIRFKFWHPAFYVCFSTTDSQPVTLKLPVMTLQPHTRPLFQYGLRKVLAQVQRKKRISQIVTNAFAHLFLFFENTLYFSQRYATFPSSLPDCFELFLLAKIFCAFHPCHLSKCFELHHVWHYNARPLIFLCKGQNIFFNFFFSFCLCSQKQSQLCL